MLPVLTDIVEWHSQGNSLQYFDVDTTDGLLYGGQDGMFN